MLHIHYGRADIDKEAFLFGQIRRMDVSGEPRALILVPDQYTLEAEQQAFSHLHAQCLMDVEVLSFSRLGSRLLSELGGSRQAFLDKYGRHMLLTRIVSQRNEDLQVFRGLSTRSSFIELLSDFIAQLKQYNGGEATLDAVTDDLAADSYLRRKLHDLRLLYHDYEEAIRGHYTDSEDYIAFYQQKIGRSALIHGNHIWIYGFDSFTPRMIGVIGQLMAHAAEVHVLLTWDAGGRDASLFALTELVMEALEREAAAVGVASRREALPREPADAGTAAAARNPAIAHIERELYALPARPYPHDAHCRDIHLVAAADAYREAESAAAFVLELVRERGFRYRDIGLVCNDQSVRGPILERIFTEYGIPLRADRKRDILTSPVVQYLLALMDIVTEGYRSEDVFRMLKSGFGPLERREVTDLENYAIKYRIRFTMWTRPFRKGAAEYGDEELARLETLRQRAVAPAQRLAELAAAAGTTGDFIDSLYLFLYEEAALPDRIADFIETQEAAGRLDLGEETSQIWGQVVRILDQMREIIGETALDLPSFSELLTVGLSQVEIGLLPPTQDGLLMGTLQRSRFSGLHALLVVGANEGVLPQEHAESGLLDREERDLFAARGAALCKVDSILFMEEKLAVYRLLSSPRDVLWVSYAATGEDGKERRPSSVYTRLRALFPDLQEERDVLSRTDAGADLPLLSAGVGTLRHLTEALQDVAEGARGTLSPVWQATLGWYRQHAPASLAPIRHGFAFTNIQKPLGEAAARELFRRDPAAALSVSPSRLERFSRCPFAHFIAYGLRPEERRVYEVAPREIGDLYHACLMDVSRRLTRPDLAVTDPGSPWMTITHGQCDEMVLAAVEAQMAAYKEGVFQFGDTERYRSGRLLRACQQTCWAMVEQVRAGRIERSVFEAAFGRGRSIPPVTVDLPSGETVYVEGIIDRVDYLPGDRVKIIDYKTGKDNFKPDEARQGYRLQLMLYLKAACQQTRKPAGVFYFNISEPRVELSDRHVDATSLQKGIRKAFRLNGILVDEPQVIEDIAGEFSDYSEVVQIEATKGGIQGNSPDRLLSSEAFDALMREVEDRVLEACEGLQEGRIDIHPMRSKDRSACSLCQYQGLCRFNTAFEGCSYNRIS